MKPTDLVLLIEDDEADVLLFERAVERAARPFPLRSAADGEEALRYLAGEGPYADRDRHPLPALVILDLKLPRYSGLEVLEWAGGRPELRSVPIVVLTSSSEQGDVRSAYRLGARAYVVKPVGFDPLRSLVAALADYLSGPDGGPERHLRAHSLPRPV